MRTETGVGEEENGMAAGRVTDDGLHVQKTGMRLGMREVVVPKLRRGAILCVQAWTRTIAALFLLFAATSMITVAFASLCWSRRTSREIRREVYAFFSPRTVRGKEIMERPNEQKLEEQIDLTAEDIPFVVKSIREEFLDEGWTDAETVSVSDGETMR